MLNTTETVLRLSQADPESVDQRLKDTTQFLAQQATVAQRATMRPLDST